MPQFSLWTILLTISHSAIIATAVRLCYIADDPLYHINAAHYLFFWPIVAYHTIAAFVQPARKREFHIGFLVFALLSLAANLKFGIRKVYL